MAVDAAQNRIRVGDVVHVPCRVVAVGDSDKHKDCLVETLAPIYPGELKLTIAINGRQCLLRAPNQTSAAPNPSEDRDAAPRSQ